MNTGVAMRVAAGIFRDYVSGYWRASKENGMISLHHSRPSQSESGTARKPG